MKQSNRNDRYYVSVEFIIETQKFTCEDVVLIIPKFISKVIVLHI